MFSQASVCLSTGGGGYLARSQAGGGRGGTWPGPAGGEGGGVP